MGVRPPFVGPPLYIRAGAAYLPAAEGGLPMDRIRRTWQLMGYSWNVLAQDKTLLVLPLFSAIASAAVLAVFLVPLIAGEVVRAGVPRVGGMFGYGILFVYLFANYFVATFFNTALVSCAVRRLRGEPSGASVGLRDAAARLPAIAGWAIVSATIGLVLRMIEDKSKLLGRIVAGLLGIAFSVASFLVVPLLVAENLGPLAALRRSAELLRRSWAEQLVGAVSFGLLFALLGIPAFAGIALGVVFAAVVSWSTTGIVVLLAAVGLAVVYLLVLGLVQATLKTIFQAAVYLNLKDGTPIPGVA